MKGMPLSKSALIALVTLLLCLAAIEGTNAAYNLTDDRISIDKHPMLGRGYSIEADQFLSTCLIVDDSAATLTKDENYTCK